MSRSVTIVTKGLRNVIASLKTFPDNLKREMDMELQAAAQAVRADAVRNAPADESGLRLSIQEAKVGDNYEVSVGKHYAPYMEFGTKKRFKPTRGFETYAQQFRGKGLRVSGETLDDAILGWVKRKRIRFEKAAGKSKRKYLTDEQTAFIIARHISFHGVRPHPFLFPAYVKQRRQLNLRIKDILKRAFQ